MATSIAATVLVLGSCTAGDDGSAAAGLPSIAVTTNILGDVVEHLVGDHAAVVTVMPIGADPHEFQASARQVDEMRGADVLVVNGAGFEEGLLDVVEAARNDGVPTFEASPGDDPHFFTDPSQMADAAAALADFLAANVPALADRAVEEDADRYVSTLRSLDLDLGAALSSIPAEDRVLVTNHDVFGPFADRYGFEVVGTVIPSGSTSDGVSGGALAELAAVVEAAGVPAIFADASSDDQLVATIADEVGDVEVVPLFSESLGGAGSGAETYVDMMRTNVGRIVDALT